MRDYTEPQEGKLGIDPERKTVEEGGRACLDWITTIRPISSTTQSAPEPPKKQCKIVLGQKWRQAAMNISPGREQLGRHLSVILDLIS